MTTRMLPCALALSLTLGLVPSFAAGIVGHFASDAAFNTYMTSIGVPGPALNNYTAEIFAPQARISSNTLIGDYEIGLHKNLPNDATPPTNSGPETAVEGSTQRIWGTSGNGNPYIPFQLKRVGNTVTFNFGEGPSPNYLYSASITNPLVGQVTLLGFRTRAAKNSNTTASKVELTDLKLGVTSIGSSVATDGGVDYLVIRNLVGDFDLKGKSALNWTGTTPSGSNLSWQIKAFIAPVPEPGTYALMAAGLAAIVAVRRHR